VFLLGRTRPILSLETVWQHPLTSGAGRQRERGDACPKGRRAYRRDRQAAARALDGFAYARAALSLHHMGRCHEMERDDERPEGLRVATVHADPTTNTYSLHALAGFIKHTLPLDTDQAAPLTSFQELLSP
jgi:hypothetical protein